MTDREVTEMIARQDEQIKTLFKQIKDLNDTYDKIHQSIDAIKEAVIEMRNLRENFDKSQLKADENFKVLNNRLDTIEKKPGDSMNKFIWLVIGAIVTIIFGFIAVQIGLK